MNKNKILSECIVIFDRHLQANLKEAMSLSLKKLFHLAENATSNQEEQELFNQYRQLKNGAKEFSHVMRTKIKTMPEFISVEVNKSDNKMSLSLVEDEELSISLSLTQLDSTLEVVSHAELYTLEKRMNVIFGNEQIDKTNMPFSPASIVWLFSHAFKSNNFAVQVKTMIIDFVTKEFSRNINQAYHEINQVFIDAGILPNIQPEMAKPVSSKASPKPPAAEGGETEQDQMQADQTGYMGEAGGQIHGQGASGGSMPQGQPGGAARQSGIAAGEYQPQTRQFDPQTKQLVESIFDLLAPPRGSAVQDSHVAQSPQGDQGPQGAQGGVSTQSIADNDFDQALAQISQESGVVATSKNIHNLKEMLADQVKNNTGNYYPELSPKQNKTLDLMGMVYD